MSTGFTIGPWSFETSYLFSLSISKDSLIFAWMCVAFSLNNITEEIWRLIELKHKMFCVIMILTFSSLYLIRSSALANLAFLLDPLMVRRRGSFLFAKFLLCFSFFLCNLSFFFVFHLNFLGGSISYASNLGLPSDITQRTVDWYDEDDEDGDEDP